MRLIADFGSVFLAGKPQYIVRFASSTGKVNAYTSYDRAEVEAIVKALDEAIALRG